MTDHTKINKIVTNLAILENPNTNKGTAFTLEERPKDIKNWLENQLYKAEYTAEG